MKKQNVFNFLIIIFFFFACSPLAWAQEQEQTTENVMSKQINTLNLDQVEKSMSKIEEELGGYLPPLNLRDILFNTEGKGFNFNFSQLFNGALRYFFQEVVSNLHLLAKLLVLAVIYSLLRNLQTSFAGTTVSKMAYLVCYLAVMGLAIGSFKLALTTGKEAIDQMVGFMQAVVPALLTILAAMGSLVSVSIFQPLTVMIISLIGTLMGSIVLPLICISAVLTLIGYISPDFPLSRLAGLFKDGALALLGLFLTIFGGAVLLQGAVSSIADGVSLQTAKFATSTFIPVVGGMFSDALEMVLGCSLLIRNALGGIGVLAILLICLFPALKIISLILTYRLAAALLQPIGDGNLVNCLSSIGNSLILIFAVLAVVSLMFFLLLTVLVGVGNIAVMMR